MAASGTSYCQALNEDFNTLLEWLTVPEKYLNRGRKKAHKIFQQFTKHAWNYGISINRTRIVGSSAKGTAICYVDESENAYMPDFDLVVFLDNHGPPFDKALNMFEAVLKNSQLKNITRTEISVHCEFHSPVYGIMNFDILPAENFVNTGVINFGQKVGDLQAEYSLENLQGSLNGIINSKVIKLHSSSFCEKGLDIIREYVEDEFYLNVVCLAKYWDSDIDLDASGRSSIIELVAIDSQRGRRNRCLISGFRRFLEAMTDMSDLYVVLQDEPDEDDPLFRQVLDTPGPIVLDPGCAYDNIASQLSREAIAIYEDQARKTLTILNGLRNSQGYEEVEDAIEEIFLIK